MKATKQHEHITDKAYTESLDFISILDHNEYMYKTFAASQAD